MEVNKRHGSSLSLGRALLAGGWLRLILPAKKQDAPGFRVRSAFELGCVAMVNNSTASLDLFLASSLVK